MESPRDWVLFVAAFALLAGAGQMAFTIIKGHVFHPSSREKFEKDSCLFWLIMAGSIAGILFGALFIILAVL